VSREKAKNYLFELTPLGKADKEVRSYLRKRLEQDQIDDYRNALEQYRHIKTVQIVVKTLFYASIVTSIAATIGLEDQFRIFQRVASYIGTSVLFVMFSITSYITLIRRENYHVQREILIAQAALEEED